MDYKNLNFDIHLKVVKRKIVYAVGILNKLKCYFPKKILLQLVLLTNLISSKFQFSKTKLFGSITQTKWNSKANPSYTNIKVLKLNKLYQYGAGKIMYYLYHKQHPCNLNQYFTTSNVTHSRPTRSSTSLMLTLPFMKSTKLQQSFLYLGVKTWNSIP